MKTAVVNFKTDVSTKQKAQLVAEQLGIPLSNLLNAYLHELAATGSVQLTIAQPMTNKTEKIIEQIESDIEKGNLSPRFETAERLFEHLDGLR